ncbi:MAG: hypothetical protein U5N86_11480 [Planctomycetota bacterium]|nr:hypothetical protein [Planctomycetota bacterium]
MARRNFTRTAGIIILIGSAVLAVFWVYRHFYFTSAGGAPAVAIDPAEVAFKVSFRAPDSSPERKLLLRPRYCFVPVPATTVTVQVLHDGVVLEGDYSMYDPVQNATVNATTKSFTFQAPGSECLTRVRFLPKAGPSLFLHMAVPLHEPNAAKGTVAGFNLGSYPSVSKGP